MKARISSDLSSQEEKIILNLKKRKKKISYNNRKKCPSPPIFEESLGNYLNYMKNIYISNTFSGYLRFSKIKKILLIINKHKYIVSKNYNFQYNYNKQIIILIKYLYRL